LLSSIRSGVEDGDGGFDGPVEGLQQIRIRRTAVTRKASQVILVIGQQIVDGLAQAFHLHDGLAAMSPVLVELGLDLELLGDAMLLEDLKVVGAAIDRLLRFLEMLAQLPDALPPTCGLLHSLLLGGDLATDRLEPITHQPLDEILLEVLGGGRQVLLAEIQRSRQDGFSDVDIRLQFPSATQVRPLMEDAINGEGMLVPIAHCQGDHATASERALDQGLLVALVADLVFTEGDGQAITDGFEDGGFTATADPDQDVEARGQRNAVTFEQAAGKSDVGNVGVLQLWSGSANTRRMLPQGDDEGFQGKGADLDPGMPIPLTDLIQGLAIRSFDLGRIGGPDPVPDLVR